MKKTILTLIFIISLTLIFGQFGQNIVQYDKFDWEYIQSAHFDIYFTGNGAGHAKFVAKEAESAFNNISKRMGWSLNERVSIIIYNSHNDFQQTNVLDTYMYEGIGGVTELYKNRVVVPYDGSHREFKHVIHHELVHAFINENIYGGNLQNLISSRIKFMIPGWMNEGLAEYLSDGWSTNSDMWMRDLAINGGDLPDIYRLNGYLSYRGGQSVWRFIAQKWGEESFSEIFYQIKKNNSVEKGLEQALGVNLKELSKQWHKYLKKEYWPDVAGRDNLPDIADRLTDHEELENSYNIAPAISPDGSQVAIISNKSGSFGMYLISAADGKFLRRIIQGEKTAEFEELHILKPGISWSPDGEQLVFGAKSGKSDALFIVDVKSGKTRKYRLGMEGIYRPAWNPVRNEIAFVGNDGANSDIYLYDLETDSLTNLTADRFTEDQISWAPDGESLLFISDRGAYLDFSVPANPDSVSIDQMDIYKIDRDTRGIERLTDTEFNESYPIYSHDGKTLIFISDESGINNVYLINDTLAVPQAITNVLTGISQLSLSSDDVQLVVTGFEKSGYDIYALSNPLARLEQNLQVEPAKWKTQKPPELRHRPTRRDISTMKVSYDNYVFTNYGKPAKLDSVSVPVKLTDEAIKDSTGSYIVNPYKTKFSLDLIQGYYSFSTQYSPQAMAYFLWSDMLGDHRIFLGTEMQISLKNSDYFFSYSYLPRKIDYNFVFFHNAESYWGIDQYGLTHLQRLRQLGLGISASAPFSRFNRLEFGIEGSYVELADIYQQLIPGTNETQYIEDILTTLETLVPRVSYVWDNTRWFQTYPVTGTRLYTSFEFSPRFAGTGLDFRTISFDARNYHKLFSGISFAGRLYAGQSFGRNANIFRVGGVPWLFSSEKSYYGENPYTDYNNYQDVLQGMYFTKYVMPVRGAQINELHGNTAVVANAEIRLPFLIYYFPTIKFIGQINMVFFSDFGMAWMGSKPRMWEGKSWDSNPQDFIWTYGFGPRFIFLGMPWQLDYAWEINPVQKVKRMWYLSIGLDF